MPLMFMFYQQSALWGTAPPHVHVQHLPHIYFPQLNPPLPRHCPLILRAPLQGLLTPLWMASIVAMAALMLAIMQLANPMVKAKGA